MKQQTLAMESDQGFEQYRRPTKRDMFLKTMNEVVLGGRCALWCAALPKGNGGRPPNGLERMMRVLFVQHWFNLADAPCEDALYRLLTEGRCGRYSCHEISFKSLCLRPDEEARVSARAFDLL